MIFSQVFVFLHFIGNILAQAKLLDDKYLDLTGLPWDIILNIAMISLMNELRKYIVIYDLISFFGFTD